MANKNPCTLSFLDTLNLNLYKPLEISEIESINACEAFLMRREILVGILHKSWYCNLNTIYRLVYT